MPYRKIYYTNEEIYHVFNRSVAGEPIFRVNSDCMRALKLIEYYRYLPSQIRYSHFNQLEKEKRAEYLLSRELAQPPNIEILSFCLMPNHFHLLLKQKLEGGISNFIRVFQNSYAKYFNTRYDRSGAVFQAMFKGVHIETDEQLLHVSRYIHLNPVTSSLIEPEKLAIYEWSSFKLYLNGNSSFVNTSLIRNYFDSAVQYQAFVLDRAAYQKELHGIKHLIFD